MTGEERPGRFGVFQALSAPPETTGQAVAYHGARMLLVLAAAAIATLLFPPMSESVLTVYDVGMLAEEAIVAEIPFSVPKTAEELSRDRQLAADGVPYTFDLSLAVADSVVAHLAAFFDRVEGAGLGENPVPIESILADERIVASPSQADHMATETTVRVLRGTAVQAAADLVPLGVLDASARQLVTTATAYVRRPDGTERTVQVDSVLTSQDVFAEAVRRFPLSATPELSELLRLILIRYVEPSLLPNTGESELDRNAARRAVPTTKADILAGEEIVRAKKQIDAVDVERLAAYNERLRVQGRLPEVEGPQLVPYLGSGLLNVLILGLFGMLVFFFRAEIYSNFRYVFLQTLMILAYLGLAWLIAKNDFPLELLPVAFVTLGVAVLWDARMALVLGLVLGVFTGVQPPFAQPEYVVLTVIGGAAAALSVRAVRRRAHTWVLIATTTAAYLATILAFRMLGGMADVHPGLSMLYVGANATASGLLAMGFLPVYEWFTGITTDQTLLEWADPNRPLLKRLSMEAPGTYAHSVNVANLAEAAAQGIGAQGLLCRVGAYYHDVGKVLKPHYFIENQRGGLNPHDRLAPETSATILREHVTEGLRLAEEAKLPAVLKDFILEHHGTQRIGFFYEKLKQATAGGQEVPEERFVYPGPTPRSRESAILMMADSVESAAKVLQDPTEVRIRELVDSLVEGKIQNRQLDDAPVTLREIHTIKGQFAKILRGMYHQRIDYPATAHLTGAPAEESAEAAESAESGESGGSEESAEVAAGDSVDDRG